MTVTLPDQERVFVVAGIVRWKRGNEYGVETLVADDSALGLLAYYVGQQIES